MVRLSVKAKPRAKKSRIVRVDGLRIEVSLAAEPVEGAANVELLRVLADALSVPRRDLCVAIGAGSKNKVVEVSGLAKEDIVSRLEARLSKA